jgi:hypothetical protein
MKIIWRDKYLRETESEQIFINFVPREREAKIIADALNANARGNDQYEAVSDDYVLYRYRKHDHEYFVRLATIWRMWFESRKTNQPMSMMERDKLIDQLQTKRVDIRVVPPKPKPKIKLELKI